jgi:hypothetical protein
MHSVTMSPAARSERTSTLPMSHERVAITEHIRFSG